MFGMPQHWPSKQPPKTRGFSLLVFVSCSYTKEFCLTQNVAGHNYELSPVVSLNPPPSDQGTNLFTNGGFQLKLRLQSCQIFIGMLIFVPVFLEYDLNGRPGYSRVWLLSLISSSSSDLKKPSHPLWHSRRLELRWMVIYEAYLKKEESTLVSM